MQCISITLKEEEYNERFSIVKLPTKKEEYTKLEEEITSQTENNERVDLVAIDMQYKYPNNSSKNYFKVLIQEQKCREKREKFPKHVFQADLFSMFIIKERRNGRDENIHDYASIDC